MFEWFNELLRKKVREAPFPDEWQEWLRDYVPHYDCLSEYEAEVLRDDTRILIREKHWEGCGGLTLTDEIRVAIAGQASMLTLCLDRKYYPNLKTILVYPGPFVARRTERADAGYVSETRVPVLGEAWTTGQMVLSWPDARSGGERGRDGRNLVFHEFAHKLDMLDGSVDGTPPLLHDEAYKDWYEAMHLQWCELTAAARRGIPTLLDQYGTTNAAELFAVATEVFFERPAALSARHPELYDVLRNYYRQDPAERIRARQLAEGG